MKSYSNLWEIFISDENIDLSIKSASKGKKKKKRWVNKCLQDPEFHNKIKKYAENFYNYKHTPKEIYDGISRKKRTIIVPRFEEQVIHHMAVNALLPMFTKGMYAHSYGSIPKRGGHKGARQICKWIRTDKKNLKYCCKMDIRKYFDSIPHDILLRKLRKKIRDDRFFTLLETIINVTPHGIPLGFFLSQWLANWYLQDLDHHIKEVLHAKYYIRYMDDLVVFDSNKRDLHKIRSAIAEYLTNELGLQMKDNWQVFLFHYIKKDGTEVGRCLDFMGFRFFRNRVTLRKSVMLKIVHKARNIYKYKKLTIHDARCMLSYIGWVDATDTYQMYLGYIKPYVNIQKCKRIVSRHDRKENVNVNHLEICREYRQTT